MADPPAQHVPAHYSHPPPSDELLPLTVALRRSLDSIKSWLHETDPARTLEDKPGGNRQQNFVATTSAASSSTRRHKLTTAAAPPAQPRRASRRRYNSITADLEEFFASSPLPPATPSRSAKNEAPDTTSNTGAAHPNMDVATSTPPPSSHPNPYAAWDPRHASYDTHQKLRATSYLLAARTDAEKKDVATSILKRWLTTIIFKRKIQSRLSSRTRVMQRSHATSVFLKRVLLPDIMNNPTSATAPTPLFTPSPRKQRYPTLAEKHPFRQRCLPLPPLPKRKRKCRHRCFRRSHQSRTRGTPRSTSCAQNLSPTTQIIHPKRACLHCPAFFHHQSDLDDHEILCRPVTTVASSEPSLAAAAVLSRDDAPSTPGPVASTLTSHASPADAVLSLAEATSLPSSHPNPSKPTEGGAVKTTYRDPSTAKLEAPPASIFINTLHQYPYLSSPEDVQLMNHLLSALQKLPLSDLAKIYKHVKKRVGETQPD